ncbi:MAG TPA: amidohydrolase family protein [Streptosporangiaceae bacterium]|nr:amidohydrolase family protein [Streptosporangiaceae bacterium]
MAQHADVIFSGGPVYTAGPDVRRLARATTDDGRPADAVAVTGGKVAAVTTADDPVVRDLAGQDTEVIGLRGRALLPGFQDAHVHPAFAGVTMMGCNLIGAATLGEAVDRIRDYAQAHPEREWISGSGWRMEWFERGTPGKAQLDQVTGSRPAFILNRDGHGGWANSRALELAGLDARTPDPVDGRFEREADGSLQGTVHEGAADLVGAFVPKPTFDERLAGLLRAQRHLHQRGITAWQDAIVGEYLGSQDPLPVYLAAARSGRLTARVRGALWWERGKGAGQLDSIIGRRDQGTAGRFTAGTVKIMQDGVAENYTAGMLEPYLDSCGCQTSVRGLSHVDPGELRAHVTALDALGFQVHFHAIGDRAVRECLDAVQAARAANGASDHRHHIAHLQVVHPDDVGRFARLGVTGNMQALWAAHEPQMDELTLPFLGPERAARQYVFGDLLRSGARLAAGSDWAVSSANPIRALHVAVNRSLQGATGAHAEPLLPGQRLEPAEAFAAYTIGSAFVNHLDDMTGSIQPGKLADLVVLDRDPITGPPAEIGWTKVLATYVEGEAVYRADSL